MTKKLGSKKTAHLFKWADKKGRKNLNVTAANVPLHFFALVSGNVNFNRSTKFSKNKFSRKLIRRETEAKKLDFSRALNLFTLEQRILINLSH